MNRITFAATLTLTAFTLLADTMPPAPVAVQPGQLQHRRKRKKLTPEQQMERFGGFVVKDYNGCFCYFMNAQKRVSGDAIQGVVDEITRTLSLPIKVETCDIEGTDIFSPLRQAWGEGRKAGAVVSIVDIAGWTSLLVAPEDGWVQVNIAALSKDNPSNEVLVQRTKKELWRAFVFLFGGGNATRSPKDLMRPINALKDLDESPNVVPGPEPFNQVLMTAASRGITPIRRTTYKQACIEGWAPKPDNSARQKIWDAVHQLPSAPIKIKPETKKVAQ